MQTTIPETSFQELEQKIKNELIRGLQFQRVTPEEIFAILEIFTQATNHQELKLFCKIFANAFPVLNRINEEEINQNQENIEAKVKAAVGKLIHTNPLLATKIAKAALTPGITWDELVIEFPELEK